MIEHLFFKHKALNSDPPKNGKIYKSLMIGVESLAYIDQLTMKIYTVK
jgi:hypothetical protein